MGGKEAVLITAKGGLIGEKGSSGVRDYGGEGVSVARSNLVANEGPRQRGKGGGSETSLPQICEREKGEFKYAKRHP